MPQTFFCESIGESERLRLSRRRSDNGHRAPRARGPADRRITPVQRRQPAGRPPSQEAWRNGRSHDAIAFTKPAMVYWRPSRNESCGY